MDKTSLRSAIAEYDRTAPARNAMLQQAETSEDLATWEAAEALALIPVQDAFYALTRDFNSRRNCGLLTIEDARDFAESRIRGRWRSTPVEQRI